ncbi:MAG: RNA 2',3'-cyclic phosphodiesterase [Gammaproteobacteria bacterium]|nr:RNA 2',3'-cyclic phosphodiesterase [Gammaproteobacteria bacterium]
MSTKRLFFALWPDDRQRDQLRNAISPVAKLVEGRAVYRGNWHVTLAFIGDFEERLIPAMHEAAGAISFEPFRLRFDLAEFWPRPKIAALSAQSVPPELEQLVNSLNSVLTDAGVMAEPRRFRPHITIVKRARPFETQRLAQPIIVEWSGFELVESVSERGGSTYHPLKQ